LAGDQAGWIVQDLFWSNLPALKLPYGAKGGIDFKKAAVSDSGPSELETPQRGQESSRPCNQKYDARSYSTLNNRKTPEFPVKEGLAETCLFQFPPRDSGMPPRQTAGAVKS
jgi:hypothetical protein